LPAASERWPSLTTIHQPVKEMGERSAQALLTAIESHTLPAGRNVMKVSLMVRNSTAPPSPGTTAG